jgi:hypothetical protein
VRRGIALKELHAEHSLHRESVTILPAFHSTYRHKSPRKIDECDHRDENRRPCQNNHAPILVLRDTLVLESQCVGKKRSCVVTSLLEEYGSSSKRMRVSSRIVEAQINKSLVNCGYTTSGYQILAQDFKTIRDLLEARQDGPKRKKPTLQRSHSPQCIMTHSQRLVNQGCSRCVRLYFVSFEVLLVR